MSLVLYLKRHRHIQVYQVFSCVTCYTFYSFALYIYVYCPLLSILLIFVINIKKILHFHLIFNIGPFQDQAYYTPFFFSLARSIEKPALQILPAFPHFSEKQYPKHRQSPYLLSCSPYQFVGLHLSLLPDLKITSVYSRACSMSTETTFRFIYATWKAEYLDLIGERSKGCTFLPLTDYYIQFIRLATLWNMWQRYRVGQF